MTASKQITAQPSGVSERMRMPKVLLLLSHVEVCSSWPRATSLFERSVPPWLTEANFTNPSGLETYEISISSMSPMKPGRAVAPAAAVSAPSRMSLLRAGRETAAGVP